MAVSYHPSVCPLDCAQTCSLQVGVDKLSNRIVSVRGSKKNPLTDGKICHKVANGMTELVHGDKRVLTPMQRVGKRGGANFAPVSWQRAYQIIKHRFSEIIEHYGAQAIAPLTYAGTMGLLSKDTMDARFFARLGATKVNSVPLCAGTSAAAWTSVFGQVGGIAHEEMQYSKLIVVWANNITVGHLHITKLIRAAQKRGAKVVVVDPRQTRIAKFADLHLAILPGTDVALAYALAGRIEQLGGIDRQFVDQNVDGVDEYLAEARQWSSARAASLCGIAAQDIDTFARWWCERTPASLAVGVALERTQNGGSALRAAFALPLLTGNFGPLGAGICKPSGYFSSLNRNALKTLEKPTSATREISILDLAQHIVDDDLTTPIKALFIYNHNPIAVHPRQKRMIEALNNEDLFVVAFDHTLTDSVAHADLVLPATTSMENHDVYKAYGHAYLQSTEPVIKPVGESKSNTQVFSELAGVFGFDDEEFSHPDTQLVNQLCGDAVNAEELNNKRCLDLSDHAGAQVVFRGAAPATLNGKAQLLDRTMSNRNDSGLPQYKPLEQTAPFTLISPSSDKRTNSTFGGTETNYAPPVAFINYFDAKKLGLNNDQIVRLSNKFGGINLPIKVTNAIRPGVISVDKGAWLKDNEDNLSINALIPDHTSDMGDGACYNDCRVEVSRID